MNKWKEGKRGHSTDEGENWIVFSKLTNSGETWDGLQLKFVTPVFKHNMAAQAW